MTEEAFGPYRLVSMLGRGGMGEVWRAVDTRKDREIALKVLGTWLGGDEGFTRRFRREAALAAKLSGPHIVPIHDYGEINGRLFIDMPLIDGTDLSALLERVGPLPALRAVEIIAHAANALDTAHRADLIHRDVKPSNILISDSGGGTDFAYLIDFGISHAADGTKISLSGAVVGTPAYMAPERFDGGGDHRADIYALGCVLYEALTGQPPFPVTSLWAYLKAHHDTPAPRPSTHRPDLPAGLDEVIARGLAKDPNDRYPTAGALAAAARAALSAATAAGPETALTSAAYPPAWAQGHNEAEQRARAATEIPPPRPASVGGSGNPPRRGRARAVVLISALAAVVVTVLTTIGITQLNRDPSGSASAPPTVTPTAATTTQAVESPRRPPTLLTTIAVGPGPQEVAVSPDGRRAYNANTQHGGAVAVIDTASNTVAETIPVGMGPVGTAATPNGRRVYITNGISGTTSVIDTSNGTVTANFGVGMGPNGVAITPDGARAYVTNAGSGTVSVIDISRDVVTATIAVGAGPDGVAVTPDGRWVYITNKGSGTVSVIDTSREAVTATLGVGSGPSSVAVTPNGRRAYVTNNASTTVSVIDTGSNTVVDTLYVGNYPAVVAVAPDGGRAYITNAGSGTVSVIDTGSNAITATIRVGDAPIGVAFTPDARRAYVANLLSGTVSVIDTGID